MMYIVIFLLLFFILNDFIRGHVAVQNKLNLSSNSGRFFLYLSCKDCQSFFFFFFLMLGFHAFCVLPCRTVGSVIRLLFVLSTLLPNGADIFI